MKETNAIDRTTFLAEQFDVYECDFSSILKNTEIKFEELKKDGFIPSLIKTDDNNIIGILSTKINEKNRILKKISISEIVFTDIISADPTDNLIYLQWMLNVFARFLKEGSEQSLLSAIRFVIEDLPQAKDYLILFENNKRKKKFKELCLSNYSLKHVSDPTNINQYKSLGQLFDAVDPFIEREPSTVEKLMMKFVSIGQAEMPVIDRNFVLYIPKSRDANVVFDKFANWCTAKEGNGMFKNYTENNRKPNGNKSDIYIIVNKKFFTGETKEMYQIHVETNQIKDRLNLENVNIFENVLSKSEALTNFFYDELIVMAKEYRKNIETNKYLDFLIKFGFAESLFEMFDENIPTLKFMKREIPRLPDLSRFKMLDQLIITNGSLVELHPSIGKMSNLEMLVLVDNNLKRLPKEIGLLKNLVFLNIIGNHIEDIPSEIALLDKSNGGSLHRIGVREDEIGSKNYLRLKELLPQTFIE